MSVYIVAGNRRAPCLGIQRVEQGVAGGRPALRWLLCRLHVRLRRFLLLSRWLCLLSALVALNWLKCLFELNLVSMRFKFELLQQGASLLVGTVFSQVLLSRRDPIPWQLLDWIEKSSILLWLLSFQLLAINRIWLLTFNEVIVTHFARDWRWSLLVSLGWRDFSDLLYRRIWIMLRCHLQRYSIWLLKMLFSLILGKVRVSSRWSVIL